MTQDELITPENKIAGSQLFFLYNKKGKEVLISTMPMKDFFEITIQFNNSFPFLNTEQKEVQNLANEWSQCLQLKENETRSFSYNTTLSNGKIIHFNFNAVGIHLPFYENSTLVLFTVNKNQIINNQKLPGKSSGNNQKDYAEFIDIAAHDLDAPLRKISLLIERLTHKNKTEPGSNMQDYFSRIQTSLADMRSLIDSLTRLSGLKPGIGKKDNCDMNMIAAEIAKEFELQESDRDISFNLSGLPVLEGDRIQYRQLLQNLVQNAVRYSKKDLPLIIKISGISLSAEEKQSMGLSDKNTWFKISISDNGIGFNQEYADNIFKPFVRLHGKSEYPGSGMGLAICRKITENHGGIIYAEGMEKSGATFTLILPQSQ